MSVVILIVGLVNGQPSEADGTYVVDYDPDGGLVVSASLEKAKRYEDMIEAIHERNRISERQPHRPDGEPNRPMTAFNVELKADERATNGPLERSGSAL